MSDSVVLAKALQSMHKTLQETCDFLVCRSDIHLREWPESLREWCREHHPDVAKGYEPDTEQEAGE